ncbi:MYG1 exonuclease, partial [Tremellales sp. Uapishka_1]
MSSPIAKKMKSTKVIGTHSGTFHCDEALAVFLLRLTDEFKDADLVRTRDPAKLEPLDIVVDVGGVYSPEKHRYDHHQRGFSEVFANGGFDKIKLSSAGLVYKHFGKHVIARVLSLEESDPKVQTLWLHLYSEFIEAVDAIDNGVNISETPLAYSNRTDLSSQVRRLNPRWNEETTDDIYDVSTSDILHQTLLTLNSQEKFASASQLTGQEFLAQLDYFAQAWLPARSIVESALSSRFSVDPSGSIVVFNQSVPWKDHLFNLEPTLTKSSTILYVLYPESTAPDAKWRIQCVPESIDSFINRKSLPETWRGVRDAELSSVSGIPGGTFCHASGFIGGNETYEGALKMAQYSIQA